MCVFVNRGEGEGRRESDRGRREEVRGLSDILMSSAYREEVRGLSDILMSSAYLPECFVENVLRCALPELRIKVKFLKIKNSTHKIFLPFCVSGVGLTSLRH